MSGHPAVGFLTAALTRAEETARAATAGPWKARHWPDGRHKVIGGAHTRYQVQRQTIGVCIGTAATKQAGRGTW